MVMQKEHICVSTDTSVSGDKCDQERSRYKDLIIEIQPMWNVKTKVIPVTAGASATVSTSVINYYTGKAW
jgi:hypothetical protein